MGQFRVWTEPGRNGSTVIRYSDGVTREKSGRFKRFTDDIVEKGDTMVVNGKQKTGKWLANELAQKLRDKFRMGKLGLCDTTLPIAPLVEKWLEEGESNNFSTSTLLHYAVSLKRFLEERPVRTIADLSIEQIKEWKFDMVSRLKNETIRGRIRDVRTFTNWLVKNGKLAASLFDGVEGLMPAQKTKDPQFYTTEEFMKLDAALAQVCPQTRLGCMLAHEMGLRKVEFIGDGRGREGVLWEDIQWKEDGTADLILRNEVVKGQKHGRTLAMTDRVMALMGSRRSGPLLTIPRSTFDHRFAKARQMAGIKSTLDVHGLRDTFAKNYLQRGNGNLGSLQDLMGHLDAKTTKIYAKFEKSYLDQGVRLASERGLQEEALLKSAGQLQGNFTEISEQSRTVTYGAAQSCTEGNETKNKRIGNLRR